MSNSEVLIAYSLMRSSIIVCVIAFVSPLHRYSRPHLHGALSEHHRLSVWVTSTLGLSKLAAQFYFYNFEIVTYL